MDEKLLQNYNQELAFIRRLASVFSNKHPGIASQLRLAPDKIDDPHVARLIESFAFQNANIRMIMDQNTKSVSSSILNIIYPQCQLPIPSASIVRINPKPDLTSSITIPRHTILESKKASNEKCHYITTSKETVRPIHIKNAKIVSQPFFIPKNIAKNKEIDSVLNIEIQPNSNEIQISSMKLNKLRIFLNAPSQYVYSLYELIFNNTVTISIGKTNSDEKPLILDKSKIKRVGFSKDENLLIYPDNVSSAYRLLTESFAFPEKFLFFDIDGLSNFDGEELHISLYFNKHQSDLEKNIDYSCFKLNCTPIINLFPQIAEPIHLDQHQTAYSIIPDARSKNPKKIYSVKSVYALTDDEKKLKFLPFYGTNHYSNNQDKFWIINKELIPNENKSEYNENVLISFVDLALNPKKIEPSNFDTINVELLCTNGNTPSVETLIPGKTLLTSFTGEFEQVDFIVEIPYSQAIDPRSDNEANWQMLSHLSLNHMSIADEQNGASALKEILKLYNVKNSVEIQSFINSILKISTKSITKRSPEDHFDVVYKGSEITVECEKTEKLYFFSSILDHFFRLFVSINSFSELVIKNKTDNKELYRWPAQIGDKSLF